MLDDVDQSADSASGSEDEDGGLLVPAIPEVRSHPKNNICEKYNNPWWVLTAHVEVCVDCTR